MLDQDRRHFLGALGSSVGGAMLARPVLGEVTSLRSVDAGLVRVSPGPWTSLPAVHADVHLESLRLRMPDGVNLHALLYLPKRLLRGQKVPGALNTTPYRNLPRPDSYLARHGYASIFVDVRGTGASEGIPTDEYAPQEHEDTAHVIDWLSKQPWSNGNVGMYGGSYSAFNSVWVAAAKKPPALKAVFALCGTDNRYTDDIHFPGGSMLMVDNSWAIGMVHSNILPGAPDFDPRSKAALDRFDTPPWLLGFLRRQLDGPYWRHGSLAPDYGRLTTPTFLAGGYLDIYQNFVTRIMKNSPAVTRGILGPWHHSMSVPGPGLDWDALKVRWFDHWLRGRDTGMLREPRVSFYMPRWREQRFRDSGDVPGEWRHADAWPETVFAPSERLYLRPEPELPADRALGMAPAPGRGGRLADATGPASALKLRYHPATGGFGQSFGPTPREGYYGLDHRAEDVWGLSFDTAPLREPLEMLGFAKARLFVSSTAPVANWIVRLCDVAADGTSYLVARGYLNGTHRRSHETPEALVPGEVYEIEVELGCAGYRFDPDHVIRVVVTNADFPVLWPSPYRMTTTLYTGGDRPSHVLLPVLPRVVAYRSAELPLSAPRGEEADGADRVSTYERTHDVAHGEHTAYLTLGPDQIWCRVREDDPATASLELKGVDVDEAPGRKIEGRAEGSLRSTETEFVVDIECSVVQDGTVVRSRRWQDRVKRELV